MVLSRWAHWNVFYLGIRFVLSSLHFCPKHLSLERITFDKGWFFEITQRIARGASLPSVPSLWCCPEFRVSRRSPRRPPLLEMENGNGVPCWGLGVRGVEMVPSKGEFLQNPEAANHVALTHFRVRMRSQDVPFCEWLYKRPEKASSCPQLKVCSCCEGVTFWLFVQSPKDSLSRAGMWEPARWEQVFSSLSHWGLLTLATWTQSLLIGKGITEFSTVCLYHSQSFFTSFLTEWELPKLQLPFSICTNW